MKRKMYVFAIAALSICVVAACGNKNSSKEKAINDTELLDDDEEEEPEAADEIEVAPDDQWTEEAVADQLRRVYKDVSLAFAPSDMEANIDLDGMYCTEDFCETMRLVRVKNQETGGEGMFQNEEIRWTYSLDVPVTPEDIKVELLTGNMAEATFNLTSGDQWMYTRLSLYWEDGQWRINSWLEVGDNNEDLLESMKRYVVEE